MDSVSHVVMGRGTYDKVMTFDGWPYASKKVFVLSTSRRYDDPQVTVLDSTRAVVDADPARLIVLEDAFQGDDQLKTNLSQLCKSKGIELWTA